MMDTIVMIVMIVAAMLGILLLLSRLSFLQRFGFFRSINAYRREQQKCSVMDVHIDWSNNTIECNDWTSQRILPFTGTFTWELWDEILPYIRTEANANGRRETHIYIIKDWGKGRNGKTGEEFDKPNWLASCEPISEYVKNKELLKTGNGYKNYYIDKQREKEMTGTLTRLTLTLPSFNSWKDIQELYAGSYFSMPLSAFIDFMQKNYPNGVKIKNATTDKYKVE